MKARQKRSLAIGVLAAMLVSGAGMGVSAASVAQPAVQATAQKNEASPLQYSEIDQMVRNQNPQIRSNELTRKNMAKNGNDQLKDAREGLEEAASGLSSLAGRMDSVIAWATGKVQAESMKPPEQQNPDTLQQANAFLMLATGNKTALSMLAGNLESQAGQMTISKNQRTLVNLQLDQVDDQMVNAAQSLFGVCKQLEISIDQAMASRPLLETSIRIAQVQASQGTGTQLAVSEAQLSLTEFDQNMATLRTQLQAVKQQLNNLLGRAYDTEFELGELPDPDLAYYNTASLESRMKTALGNSYTLRYKLEELHQMNDEDEDDDKEEYKSVQREKQIKRNEIAMEEASVQAALAKQDQSVKTAQASDSLQKQKMEIAKAKAEQAQLKYRLGMASKVEVESAQAEYESAQAACKNAQLELFNQIEAYRWIVKGLPASSGS